MSWPFLVMIKPSMQPQGHGFRIVMFCGPGVSPPPTQLPSDSSDTVTSVLPSFSDVGQGKIEAAPLARGRFTLSGRATMPPLTSVGSTVTTSCTICMDGNLFGESRRNSIGSGHKCSAIRAAAIDA